MAAKTPSKPAKKGVSENRTLKAPKYKSFRLQRRIKHPVPDLTGGFTIFMRALKLLAQNWRLFGGIILIYGILQILLVQGFGAASDVREVRDSLSVLADGGGGLGRAVVGLTSFGYMLSTSGAGSAYQMFTVLIVSLALIWTLRQVHEGERPRVRDGFYFGMFPLVPFILVLLVVGLQLVPAIVVGSLYSVAAGSGVIVTGIEHLLWMALLFSAVTLTLYMICSSLFALYIVTLPGMTPLKALRTARELVRHRRWVVMRRIILMPVLLVLMTAIVVVPLIIFAAPLAAWVFLAVSFFGLAAIHSYLYGLFKELLG